MFVAPEKIIIENGGIVDQLAILSWQNQNRANLYQIACMNDLVSKYTSTFAFNILNI
jgi:hypothetical protein